MKVMVIPIVIGALSVVTKGMVQGLKDLEIRHTVLWFQVFLSNTNNFQTDLFDPYIGP